MSDIEEFERLLLAVSLADDGAIDDAATAYRAKCEEAATWKQAAIDNLVPDDELRALYEAKCEEAERLTEDIGYYEGNSIQYWAAKAKAYKACVRGVWGALHDYDVKPDGKTSVVEAVRMQGACLEAAERVCKAVGKMKVACSAGLEPDHERAVKNVAWNRAWTAHTAWEAPKEEKA